jgi:tetratricopeptide (TPR) repeat protein
VRAGAHAFELMGVPVSAGRVEVRTAWHGLSRRFHPDALAHQELGHLRERSAAVFASLNEAYQILSDTRQREELAALLRAGGRPHERDAPAPTTQAILESEAIAREGDKQLRAGNFERALERYRKAAELSPEDLELRATIAWCEYQRSADKAPLRGPTEVTLRGVLARQPRCARAHYFLGLLYMHANDDQAALAAFTAALEIEPEMLDAKRQIHAIELRGSTPPATDPRSSGVFRRRT